MVELRQGRIYTRLGVGLLFRGCSAVIAFAVGLFTWTFVGRLAFAIGLFTWTFVRWLDTDPCISKEDRLTYQEDLVTYVELWKLVKYASQHKQIDMLGDVIAVLRSDGNENQEITNEKDYYDGLCRWKGTCEERMQRTTLFKTLYENGLGELLAFLKDFRGTVLTEICLFDLEHILWEIGEQDEISKFLESLKIDPPEIPRETETSLKIFHQQALDKLITWTRVDRDINPVIILSFTLEKLNHKSANNFFHIPDEQKHGLADSEYKELARNFSRHHVDMLAAIIKCSTNTVIMVSKTLEENRETLFNIEEMLRDWWEEQNCSNYKRRCQLDATFCEMQQKVQEDTKYTDEQWPSDDELKLFARYLDQESTNHLNESLGMSDLSESADEKKRFEALCAWIQSYKGEWKELHGQLVSAVKDPNISGLLSPLRNDAFHKVEVVDIAFRLLMTDILPLVRLLGVCEAKLSSYRPVFEPSHLTQGTIGLVSTLFSLLDKKNQREDLWRKLREGGFPSTIQREMIVYEISCGELSAISDAVKSEENTKNNNPLPGTQNMLSPHTTKFPMASEVGETKESGHHFNEIKKMLNLTDEEVAAGSLATDPPEVFTLFKIWKEKFCLSAFNYRAALIKDLHEFGKPDIARSLIEGNYKADEKSLSFIKHMVKKVIADNRLERLAEALNLEKDLPGAQRSDDDISETICERLMVLKHAPGVCNQRVKGRDRKSFKKHNLQVCQFDKLVDHGFLDLARELLIIDKQ